MTSRLLAAALALLLARPANAADQLRVGYAAQLLCFAGPLLAAQDQGIFRAHGLEVEALEFAGGAKLHQGVVANAVDVALAGGTDFAYIVKGAPERVVANISAPTNTVISATDPTIRTLDDLRGKHVGVTSIGTYTYWAALELARTHGWGAHGVTPVAIGGAVAVQLSALRTGQVAASMGDAAVGYALQQRGDGQVLGSVADYAPDVPANLIFARNDLIEQRPDVLRRFLASWLEAVAWLITHKQGTIAIGQRITGQTAEVVDAVFELQLPGWSRDGRITQTQLAAIARALVQSGLLDSEPNLSSAYQDNFLPK